MKKPYSTSGEYKNCFGGKLFLHFEPNGDVQKAFFNTTMTLSSDYANIDGVNYAGIFSEKVSMLGDSCEIKTQKLKKDFLAYLAKKEICKIDVSSLCASVISRIFETFKNCFPIEYYAFLSEYEHKRYKALNYFKKLSDEELKLLKDNCKISGIDRIDYENPEGEKFLSELYRTAIYELTMEKIAKDNLYLRDYQNSVKIQKAADKLKAAKNGLQIFEGKFYKGGNEVDCDGNPISKKVKAENKDEDFMF